MGKRKPLRMCVACRQLKEKKDLIRIVKNGDGTLKIDETFRAGGRGAYLCKNKDCLKKCIKSKALNRALKCSCSPEFVEEMKQKIEV